AFEDRGERRLAPGVTRRLFAVREGDQASEPAILTATRPAATAAFVGRGDEMARLDAALDAAFRGAGGLVMLSGDPGIGKSRTAAELAARAEARGALVLVGRCYEREGAPPYWPWVQILRGLAREGDPESVRRWMGPGAAEIASLVPEVAERLGPVAAAAPVSDPEQARFRLLDAVACALAAASEDRPLLLVLEDLHAADPGSLRLLELVARELAGHRALLVGSYRDGEVPRAHPLAETLAELSREGRSERVALEGLSRRDVERFIAAAAGRPAPPGLVDACLVQTEGNPLFLTELVRLLLQEGGLAWGGDEGDWTPRIPEGVRAVIARRLDRLSEPCRATLGLGAALGREVDLRTLCALADDAPEDEVLEALEEAAAARVLDEVPGSAGRYAFSHALIRETLLEELSAARRARLHARAVAALERLYGDAQEAHAAEILHHALQAEPLLGPEPVVRHALAAGEAALASRAYEEAADLFRRALDTLGPAAADDRAAAAHFGLGRALLASRELHELDEAVASLRRAFDLLLAAGEPGRAIAVAAHPLPPHLMYEPTGVTRLVSRALELAPPDSAEAARLLAVRGWFAGIDEADADRAQESF
ncbi:MAG TPA: AAA family ATPase, partial [Miltoncostaeaceae bacterium]|nr:AAA family ATPase [Miltoncostaeaceae bacterium]